LEVKDSLSPEDTELEEERPSDPLSELSAEETREEEASLPEEETREDGLSPHEERIDEKTTNDRNPNFSFFIVEIFYQI